MCIVALGFLACTGRCHNNTFKSLCFESNPFFPQLAGYTVYANGPKNWWWKERSKDITAGHSGSQDVDELRRYDKADNSKLNSWVHLRYMARDIEAYLVHLLAKTV